MSVSQSVIVANSTAVARAPWLRIAMLACAIAGCASSPQGPGTIDMISRENNIVSHGIVSSYFPRTTQIDIDVERRIYSGKSEPTPSNQTFGFIRTYGQGRYPPSSSEKLLGNNYFKAILSSSDSHTLRCDLRVDDGVHRDGICLDDFGRVYDVVPGR